MLLTTDQQIAIEGHTDSQGKATHNWQLSDLRAKAVRDLLIAQGIPSARIESIGKSDVQPVADNRTAEGRANNRRVEIVLRPVGALPAAPATPSVPRMQAPPEKP